MNDQDEVFKTIKVAYNQPVAEFRTNGTIVTNTAVPMGTDVAFTDASSNFPTEWGWGISPATGWSFVNSSNSSQSPVVRFTTPGVYTVSLTATNPAGTNTRTKVNHITVTGTPPVAAFSANGNSGNQLAIGQNTTVNFTDASTNSPTIWSWNITPASGWYFSSGSSTSQNPSVSFSTPGYYTVALTASNAYGSNTVTKSNLIATYPPPPVVSSYPAYCQGAPSSPLVASGTNLRWYTVASGGTGSTVAPTPSTNSVGTTTYYVSQLVNGLESNRTRIDVTVNAIPNAPTVTSSLSFCQGATIDPLTAIGASGSSLRWYTTPTGGSGSTVAPTPSTGSLGSTTYYVSQVLNGCESSRSAITATISNQLPLPTVSISGSLSFCTGTGTGLTAISNMSGVKYRWMTGLITPSVTATTAGIFSVTGTAPSGCTASSSVTVTSFQTPSVSIATSQEPGSTTLTATSTSPNITYSWNTGATTPSITVTASGPYSVTGTAPNSCTVTSTTSVTITSLTVAISGNLSVCTGGSTILTATSNAINPSYRWSTGETTSALTVSPTATSAYAVTVTSGPARAVASTSVLFFTRPVLSLSTLSSSTAPGSATLSVSSSQLLSRLDWLKDGTTVSSSPYSLTTLIATVGGGNGQGSGANQFNFPYDIFVDGGGNVLVADRNNHRIQKWAPGATTGVTVAGGNGAGAGANQLASPLDIFIDASGNLYIADQDNHRIQKWAPGATSGVTVAGGNGAGSAANQLSSPSGVFVDAEGNVFVADVRNNRVQRWAPGATIGMTVAGGNGAGSGANQLNGAAAVFVDGSGNIFVVDAGNHRIQRWAIGATVGVTVAGGNGAGSAANQLNQPLGVFVDKRGNVLVADHFNYRIQRWAPGGSSGETVAGGNGVGSGVTQLNLPTGVVVDDDGNVFVVDHANHRIQRWTTRDLIIRNTFVPTQEGQYQARGQSANGCLATSNSVFIGQPISVSISGSLSICAGTSTTLTASSNSPSVTFRWSNGATTAANVILPTTTTTYSVTATNPGGQAITSVTIQVGQVPVLSLSNLSNSSTPGSATLSVNSSLPLSRLDWLRDGTVVSSAPYSLTASGTGATVAGGNGQGSAANQFFKPVAVWSDSQGNLLVADQLNFRVQRWAPGATSGVTVAGGNGLGSAANQLRPSAVFVDAQNNLYVADDYNHRVQWWPSGGTAGITVAGGNGLGSAANQLNNPRGLYVDGQGNVFVSDANNHRIQRWAPGATAGVTIAGGNGQGSAANQLNYPWGVYVNGQGNLYVSDQNNFRVQRWAPGATSGTTVAGGNGQGLGPANLNGPSGLFVDNGGTITVSDYTNNRIQRWAPGATIGVTVAGGDTYGSAANQLAGPWGVYVNGQGAIFVADRDNNRVQRWEIPVELTTSNTYVPTQEGSYQASGQLANGCQATSNILTIGQPISVSISGNTSLCNGASTTLTATANVTGATFRWNTGVTSATILASASDVYSVTATAPGGATATQTVTVFTQPQITAQPPASLTLCAGGPLSVSVGVSGTAVAYQWYKGSLSSPLGSQTSAVLSLTTLTSADAGTYFCVISTPCGNLTSQTLQLSVGQGPLTSVKTGSWNDPMVWSCNRVPTVTDIVILRHPVSLPASYQAQVQRIVYEIGGSTILATGAKVSFQP
ncbi:Ig-like domain-containing protein [Rudanella paleaurantiibacter]|nr:PKD domain-containing protein [Rudanella paleaurantiibacter]